MAEMKSVVVSQPSKKEFPSVVGGMSREDRVVETPPQASMGGVSEKSTTAAGLDFRGVFPGVYSWLNCINPFTLLTFFAPGPDLISDFELDSNTAG